LDFDLWEFGSETVCPRQTGTGMSARFVRLTVAFFLRRIVNDEWERL
jgi:hypothetical protein